MADFNEDTGPKPIIIKPLPDMVPNTLMTCEAAADGHESFVITTLGSASVLHDHPYAMVAESANDQGMLTIPEIGVSPSELTDENQL